MINVDSFITFSFLFLNFSSILVNILLTQNIHREMHISI